MSERERGQPGDVLVAVVIPVLNEAHVLERSVTAVRQFMLLTARLVDAREAQAIGLVDEVLPADRLEARVRELARRVATLAPLTFAAIKAGARRVSQGFALRDAEQGAQGQAQSGRSC